MPFYRFQKSRPTIGLLINRFEGAYQSTLARGAEAGAEERNANLLIFVGGSLGSADITEESDSIVFELARSQKLDGLIFSAGILATHLSREAYQQYLHKFKNTPSVCISLAVDGIPCVLTDNRKAMADTINHLIEFHGYQRIAYIGGPLANPEAVERLEGYRNALDAHGIVFDPSLVVEGDVGAEDVQILECKTAGINGARLWKEGVPEYVQLQVMHQLAVTGKQAADVAVLLGGQHVEIHRIERDDLLIARLMRLEQQFWQYVIDDTPPPADGSDSAEIALRTLFPQDSGEILDFSQEPSLSAAFTELQAVREILATHEKREAQLKQAMGDATKAVFESGCVTWKKAKDSESVDLKRLLQDHPELQAQYTVIKPGSRRFLIV